MGADAVREAHDGYFGPRRVSSRFPVSIVAHGAGDWSGEAQIGRYDDAIGVGIVSTPRTES